MTVLLALTDQLVKTVPTWTFGTDERSRDRQNAEPEDKARVHSERGQRLTYHPAQQIVRAEVNLDPNDAGVVVCVRGGT
jgi:lipoate-protein ligase B